MSAFRTELCDLFGIDYPIVQSGMGGVAGPELVAEVCEAGALGILAGLGLKPDELRDRIRQIRALTRRPFGVNLFMPTELRPPADVAKIPDDVVTAVQSALNRFRQRLGLPTTFARPQGIPDVIDAAFEVILDERPAVWSIGLGDPGEAMTRACRARGIKVMAMVTNVEDARTVAARGVDVVVAQGAEAGGHRSVWVRPRSLEAVTVGTMALVPQLVDALSVPVVAAGGISDGRGLVAALALGASGALLGTRFVATRESLAPEFWKKALLERSGETTTISDSVTGLHARYLRNTFIEEYGTSGAPVLPALIQARAAQDIFAAAVERQAAEYVPMPTGQGVGLIHDLPGAREVVETIVREAGAALDALPRRVSRA